MRWKTLESVGGDGGGGDIGVYMCVYTVELRSKGPATKGNRSLRDNGAKSRLFPFSFLLFEAPARWDTAIRETSAFGKDFLVP